MIEQLNESYVGKRLRVNFADGEIADIQVLGVALPNKYDNTAESWGLTYDLIATNRPRIEPKGSAFWAQLDTIKSFEIIGDLS
jgi:hypothetical protein